MRAKSQWVAVGLLALACMGCGERAKAPERTGVGSPGMPAFFPGDALLLRGPADLVLAEGDHGILLTLGEYNGRAFDERLPADLDTAQARARYLESLIDLKVAAVEARLRGYVPKDTSSLVAQERDLAQQLLQQSILTANNIPDAEALEFIRAHPEEFPDVDANNEQSTPDLMHAKYKMQDRRLREQLESWKQRENVVVHADRVAGLNSSSDNAAGSSSSQETQP